MEKEFFMNFMEELTELAQKEGSYVTKDWVKKCFGDIEMGDSQWMAVYQYLGEHNIQVEGYRIVQIERENKGQKSSGSSKKSKMEAMYLRDLKENGIAASRDLALIEKHLKAYVSGDTLAREELIHSLLGVVTDIVSEYKKGSIPMEDMIAEGNLGIMQGMLLFEADMEKYHETDIFMEMMREEIFRSINAMIGEEMDIRRKEHEMVGKLNLLRKATEYLCEENGQIPSVEELAEFTKVTAEEIEELRKISGD